MGGLVDATALSLTDDGFIATLDPAWDIWGPAGGYIAAIALRAVGAVAASGHRPVTQSGQFVRVARPGQITVRVEPVKLGGSALYAITLTQEGNVIFLSQIWTTARSDVSFAAAPPAPDVPAAQELTGLDAIMRQRGMKEIAFWQNLDGRPFEFRVQGDPLPKMEHQYRWMRFRDWSPTDDPFVDAMRAVMLIDIGVWPAHWHRLTQAADYMAPSLDIAVHFHGGAAAGDWLLSDADTDVSGNGTISGRVRIWSEDGRVIATGSGHCLVIAPKPSG
jgi:acyl-CoA thioesterase